MKKVLLIVFLGSLPFLGFSQKEKQINTSFREKMDNMFRNLEKERVPDGILLDFGMEFTNVRAFNGTLTDSTYVYFNTLDRIYKTLLTSRIQDERNKGFVTPKAFNQDWRENRSSDYIALSGLYFKYARFTKDAYPEKLNFSVTNQSQI